MSDIEKIIKGLECCSDQNHNCYVRGDCPYCSNCWFGEGSDKPENFKHQLLIDTLELLKELIDQRHYYEEWEAGYGKNQQQIVRCKDCKHGEVFDEDENYIACSYYESVRNQDWFCAEGEKKDDN